jgi:hypothetical protein
MAKTVRGAVNVNTGGHFMLKTVRGAVYINYW